MLKGPSRSLVLVDAAMPSFAFVCAILASSLSSNSSSFDRVADNRRPCIITVFWACGTQRTPVRGSFWSFNFSCSWTKVFRALSVFRFFFGYFSSQNCFKGTNSDTWPDNRGNAHSLGHTHAHEQCQKCNCKCKHSTGKKNISFLACLKSTYSLPLIAW